MALKIKNGLSTTECVGSLVITNSRGHTISVTDVDEAIQVENLSDRPCTYTKNEVTNVFAFSCAEPKSFWKTFSLLIK